MTEKISTRTPELERRLEYAKRIRKAVDYKGTADHEDVQSILKEFQDEVIREFSDRIVEKLESEIKWMKMLTIETCSLEAESHLCGLNKAIDIVKGVEV